MAIETKLFGVDPMYFHVVSVAIHALNAVLVFYLVFRLSRKKYLSYLTAIIFGLHAIQTESVAWAWQQNILWMTAVLLASLLLTLKYIDTRSKSFYILAILFAIFATLMKEQLIGLPILVFAMSFLLIKKTVKESLFIAEPFLLAPFIYFSARALSHISFVYKPWDSFFSVLNTMIQSFAYYILLIFYPRPLSINYDDFISTKAPGLLLAGALLSITILIFFLALKKTPIISFGILWFFVSLATVSNIIIPMPQIMNERFAYFGSIGLIISLVFGLHLLLSLITNRSRTTNALLSIVLLPYIVVLAYLSFIRLGDWKDSVSLWKQTVAVAPLSARSYNNYGVALHGAGRFKETILNYSMAIDMLGTQKPIQSFHGLLNALASSENEITAKRVGEKLLKNFSEIREIHYAYGKFLLETQQFKEAEVFWLETIEKFGKQDAGLFYLLYAQTMLGADLTKTNSLYQPADDFKTRIPNILQARKLIQENKYQEAQLLLSESLVKNPTLPVNEPYEWLAQSYIQTGNLDNAVATYIYLLQLSPDEPNYVFEIKKLLSQESAPLEERSLTP
jgi:tetratricopeptide (TPR) repeat protein